MKEMVFFEFFSIFCAGSLGYGALELLWRGHTHWTMLLMGGVCFLLIHLVATRMHDTLWKKWVMCAALITMLEFVVGCIVNLRLGWGVWDYSNERFNLMGQICPQFTLLWFLLSIPCVAVSRLCKRFVFKRPDKR